MRDVEKFHSMFPIYFLIMRRHSSACSNALRDTLYIPGSYETWRERSRVSSLAFMNERRRGRWYAKSHDYFLPGENNTRASPLTGPRVASLRPESHNCRRSLAARTSPSLISPPRWLLLCFVVSRLKRPSPPRGSLRRVPLFSQEFQFFLPAFAAVLFAPCFFSLASLAARGALINSVRKAPIVR